MHYLNIDNMDKLPKEGLFGGFTRILQALVDNEAIGMIEKTELQNFTEINFNDKESFLVNFAEKLIADQLEFFTHDEYTVINSEGVEEIVEMYSSYGLTEMLTPYYFNETPKNLSSIINYKIFS